MTQPLSEVVKTGDISDDAYFTDQEDRETEKLVAEWENHDYEDAIERSWGE
jgi:3-dehydroquinate synthetase